MNRIVQAMARAPLRASQFHSI